MNNSWHNETYSKGAIGLARNRYMPKRLVESVTLTYAGGHFRVVFYTGFVKNRHRSRMLHYDKMMIAYNTININRLKNKVVNLRKSGKAFTATHSYWLYHGNKWVDDFIEGFEDKNRKDCKK